MDAYSVRVTYADSSKLDYHAWCSYEKNELFIGASSRLVNFSRAAHLDSLELASQFRDAIIARQHKKGHIDFEAEVQQVRAEYKGFTESIETDSRTVREKLETWGYPKPGEPTDHSGWVIQVKHEDKAETFYLVSLSKNGSVKLSSNKNLAKRYKQNHFVQKALIEINKSPKLRAVATETE
jgi:hypothetical protein